MTDYSSVTDEQVNEAIFKIKYPDGCCIRTCYGNQIIPSAIVRYTHDWRLAGELLEEMPITIELGRNRDGGWDCIYEYTLTAAPTPQRAICEAWLAWKERG